LGIGEVSSDTTTRWNIQHTVGSSKQNIVRHKTFSTPITNQKSYGVRLPRWEVWAILRSRRYAKSLIGFENSCLLNSINPNVSCAKSRLEPVSKPPASMTPCVILLMEKRFKTQMIGIFGRDISRPYTPTSMLRPLRSIFNHLRSITVLHKDYWSAIIVMLIENRLDYKCLKLIQNAIGQNELVG
jgi:hypothetical protein